MFRSTFHAAWKALLRMFAPRCDSEIQVALEGEAEAHGVSWLRLKIVYMTSGSISILSART